MKNKDDVPVRDSWTGRAGFILAAAGFAIGLGNIWRFSYVVGENGGGAFLIIYLAIILLVGLPLFLIEAGLGRKAQTSAVMGLRKFTRKGSPWVLIGWLGLLASGLIMSYYIMIMGWLFSYIFKVGSGVFQGLTTSEISGIYDDLVANPMVVFAYSLIPAVIIAYIVSKGIKDGIERFSKIVMPILLVMLVVLAGFSLSLPGAFEGVVWYLKPDFSVVTFGTFLEALGQAFFSVGIGFAAAFTYGSYLKPKDSNLVGDGIWVVSLDTFIAFISGLVIFPALFAFNIAPDSGPGLIFITIPNLLDQLPGGLFFGVLFFFLIIIAALTTGVGLVEALVSNVIDIFKFKRSTSVLMIMSGIVVFSVPSILSHGPWEHITFFGRNMFELIDYISGNVILTIGGLLLALYVTFVWKFDNFRNELNVGTKGIKISPMLQPIIKTFIPLLIIVVFITSVF